MGRSQLFKGILYASPHGFEDLSAGSLLIIDSLAIPLDV
jgi:hypothetical protein